MTGDEPMPMPLIRAGFLYCRWCRSWHAASFLYCKRGTFRGWLNLWRDRLGGPPRWPRSTDHLPPTGGP